MAALVSIEDLARLESSPEDAEERYRKALKEAGIEVTYPSGNRVPKKRRLIRVKGRPVSEQIIADRR